MPLIIPKDHRKIRERIRRYERLLQKENEETGCYHDGSGKRYLLGPLYLLMNDLDGAMESFRWYKNTFLDDSGEAGHNLCWTLALYRNGETEAARKKLKQTMLMNLFIIPRLLGIDIAETELESVQKLEDSTYKGWGFTGEESFYIDEIPSDYFAVWNDEERGWALQLYQSREFKAARARLIEIRQELASTPPGPRQIGRAHV